MCSKAGSQLLSFRNQVPCEKSLCNVQRTKPAKNRACSNNLPAQLLPADLIEASAKAECHKFKRTAFDLVRTTQMLFNLQPFSFACRRTALCRPAAEIRFEAAISCQIVSQSVSQWSIRRQISHLHVDVISNRTVQKIQQQPAAIQLLLLTNGFAFALTCLHQITIRLGRVLTGYSLGFCGQPNHAKRKRCKETSERAMRSENLVLAPVPAWEYFLSHHLQSCIHC